MSKSDEQWLFLKDIAKLIQYADAIGIKLTGGELYRTKEQQDIYVQQGKSKTYKSKHLERLAMDFNFFINGQLTYNHPNLEILGLYWESLSTDNRWGGHFKNFKDTPHFERNIK